MPLAKIFRMEDGVLTSTTSAIIQQNNFNNVTKKLENNVTEFAYSDASLVIKYLDRDFFEDYTQNIAYLIEIQDGSGVWDGPNNYAVFFGLINRKNIEITEPLGDTRVQVFSMDKLLELSPDIVPRGIYNTGLISELSSNQMGTAGTRSLGNDDPADEVFVEWPVIFDGVDIDDYLDPGATIIFSQDYEFGDVEYRGVIREEDTGFGGPGRRLKTDLFHIGRVEKLFTPDSLTGANEYFVSYDIGDPDDDPMITIQNHELIRNHDRFTNGDSSGFGWLTFFEPNGSLYDVYSFNIESAAVVDDVYIRFTVSPHVSGDIVNLVSTQFQWTIIPHTFVKAVTEVTLFHPEMYGVGSGSIDDYDVQDILQGLIDIVPILKDFNPIVAQEGTPLKLSRLITLDNNPAKALSQMQRNTETLIDITYGDRQANGLRQVVFDIITRDEMKSRDEITISVPIAWSEKIAIDRPIIIVQGSSPFNVAVENAESYGWYFEDNNGDPAYTLFTTSIPSGDRIIKIELDLVPPGGVSFYEGKLKDFYYNDDVLRDIAQRYFDFYGQYFKPVTLTLNGVFDTLLGYPFTVSWKNKDGVTVSKNGISISQEIDYIRRNTVIKGRLSM